MLNFQRERLHHAKAARTQQTQWLPDLADYLVLDRHDGVLRSTDSDSLESLVEAAALEDRHVVAKQPPRGLVAVRSSHSLNCNPCHLPCSPVDTHSTATACCMRRDSLSISPYIRLNALSPMSPAFSRTTRRITISSRSLSTIGSAAIVFIRPIRRASSARRFRRTKISVSIASISFRHSSKFIRHLKNKKSRELLS